MNEAPKPSYWAVLPAKVRYDTGLRPNAKLLYAEITALANASGYCYAKNEYLAGLFSISGRTVSDLISSLSSHGYVAVEIIRDEKNQIVERRIYVDKPVIPSEDEHGTAQDPIAENSDTPIADFGDTPIAENGAENNININNIPPIVPQGGQGVRKKREPKKTASWKPERFERFWSFYPVGKARQAAIRAWDKLHPDDSLVAAMGLGLMRQMASAEWQRGIGIPYASSWLNQRRWEDEERAAASPQTANDGGWAPDNDDGSWTRDPEVR